MKIKSFILSMVILRAHLDTATMKLNGQRSADSLVREFLRVWAARTRLSALRLVAVSSCALILPGFAAGTFAAEKNTVSSAFTFSTSPNESVLLLDDHAVARTKNLTQKFFPAGKHPANPVMRRSEPWEGVGPYVFCNRLMQDEKTGQLRLWYVGHRPPIEYAMGYATSFDGLKWTKPDLAVCRVGDKSALNCIVPDRNADGTGSFVRDPRPGTPSHRRYMGVKFTYEGEMASFSPDESFGEIMLPTRFGEFRRMRFISCGMSGVRNSSGSIKFGN